MPPHQQTALTTPALRGPTCSSQPPQSAAEQPRMTKNVVYIQPSVAMCQLQLVVKSSAQNVMSLHSGAVVAPSAFDSGSQNTEKPYAMPMHKWMASAAGGTSQRLKPAPAMVRSLASRPGSPGGASGSFMTADIRSPEKSFAHRSDAGQSECRGQRRPLSNDICTWLDSVPE